MLPVLATWFPMCSISRDPRRDEAHLTIVFAALAVSRWIEARTGLSPGAGEHVPSQ